uniref:Chitin-binding type-2 domain-containing protein n=1 Tax=Daphnia galeata TaxID=27404 RepID=A0A8J2RT94_9CRUS|nr:unnamed protein product [Daphnia galeata]
MQKAFYLSIIGISILSISSVSTIQQHGDVLKQVEIDCIKRPRPYKIADKEQCDKYYICDNGVATPKLCEDGTVFYFPIQNCVLLNGADCNGRPLLQESIKTNHCPKKTGLFPHEDPVHCDKYYQCLDGHPTLIKCPDLLLFDRVRGVCDYADLADTSNCLLEPSPIVCPSGIMASSSSSLDVGNRLIAHPKDCNKFFFCETTIPRPLACEKHLAFDLETLTCIEKSKVHRW